MEVNYSAKPILGQLLASVNSGLNAVLSPRDCKILLIYVRHLEAKKPGSLDGLLEVLGDNLEDLKDEFLDKLFFKKGKP